MPAVRRTGAALTRGRGRGPGAGPEWAAVPARARRPGPAPTSAPPSRRSRVRPARPRGPLLATPGSPMGRPRAEQAQAAQPRVLWCCPWPRRIGPAHPSPCRSPTREPARRRPRWHWPRRQPDCGARWVVVPWPTAVGFARGARGSTGSAGCSAAGCSWCARPNSPERKRSSRLSTRSSAFSPDIDPSFLHHMPSSPPGGGGATSLSPHSPARVGQTPRPTP